MNWYKVSYRGNVISLVLACLKCKNDLSNAVLTTNGKDVDVMYCTLCRIVYHNEQMFNI